MPHTPPKKPASFRFPEETNDALDAVAAELGLNRTDTVSFLVRQKARELGLNLRDENSTRSSQPAATPPPDPPAQHTKRARRGRR